MASANWIKFFDQHCIGYAVIICGKHKFGKREEFVNVDSVFMVVPYDNNWRETNWKDCKRRALNRAAVNRRELRDPVRSDLMYENEYIVRVRPIFNDRDK